MFWKQGILFGILLLSSGLTVAQAAREDSIPFARFARILSRELDIRLAYDSRALSSLYLPEPGMGNNPDSILSAALFGKPFSFKQIGEVYTVFPILEAGRGSTRYSGQILDSRSGESLPFASITVIFSGKVVPADQNGRFVLFDLPSDTCRILCQYIGYENRIFRISELNTGADLRVYLKPNLQRLPVAEVVASESAPISYDELSGTYLISTSFPGLLNGAGVLDPLRALQITPGVSASQPLNTGTNIRGAAPDQSVVLFDGIPLHQPDHFFGFVSVLNPEIIRGARVKKSTFPASEPDVNAAILEFSAKEGSRFAPKTSVNVGLNTSDLYYSAPLPGSKGSFLISGRRAMSDLWPGVMFNTVYRELFESASAYSALLPRGSYRSEPKAGFSFHDLVARLTLEPGERDRVRFTFINSGDRFSSHSGLTEEVTGIELDLNDSSRWGTSGFSAHLDHFWSSSSQTNLAFSVADYSASLVQEDFLSDPRFSASDSVFSVQESSLRDMNLKVNHEVNFPSQTISAGFWVSSLNTTSGFTSVTDKIESESRQKGNNYAIFIQDIIRLGRGISASTGMRLSYFDLSGDFRGEPRVYFDWEISRKARFRLSYGRHHQFLRRLRRQDLYLGTTDLWRLSNLEAIPVLNASVVSLSFGGKWKNVSYEAEWYFRETEGELADALIYRGFLGSDGSTGFFDGSGRFSGLDISASWANAGFTANAVYSLSSSQLRFSELSFGTWSYSPFDIPHQLKLLAGFSHAGWDAAATLIVSSGMRHTPALGVYTSDLINGETFTSVVLGQAFSESLPTYSRLDLSVFREFSRKSRRSLQCGVFVRNVLNQRNERDRLYSVNPQSNTLVTRRVEDLGIVPGISLKWIWE